jgi:hypothetical protein
MRPLTALLGSLTIPLLLSACGDDQSLATAPTPALALSAGKPVALDPSHTYRFDFACSSAVPNSLVTITTATNIPRISVTCNSWTEMGAVNGTFFNEFGYEISLDSPGGKECSAAGLMTTGTFKCRFHKYTASLTVTDEGVITP